MNKILLRVLIIVAIVVLVLIGSLCALRICHEINVKKLKYSRCTYNQSE